MPRKPTTGAHGSDRSNEEGRGSQAVQAFLEMWAAHKHRRAPDPRAVRFLAEAWTDYWHSQGEKTLDEVLELTGTRGRRPILRAVNDDLRDGWYRHLVAVLVGAGFTLDEAAEATAEHQSTYPEELAKVGAKPLQSKTVRDIFERLGGIKWARENNYLANTPELVAERGRFISGLPDHVIPARFRNPRKS